MRAKGIIVVNFKTYKEATGKKALSLAKKIATVSKASKTSWIICPQHADLWIAKHVPLPVFAQHVDACEPGRNTGFVTPYSLKTNGIKGSIINHSEHRLPMKVIENTITLMKKYDLMTIVCANSPREAAKIAKLRPDFVAVEPPELIGTGISVSRAQPEIIEKSAKAVKKYGVKFLCGAGISSGEDVRKAIELGADGVLVASAIAKAQRPLKVIKEFAEGLYR
jgi:triosephosphate isomerase